MTTPDDIHVCTVSGEIDVRAASMLRKALFDSIAIGETTVVDLTAVTFFGVAGICAPGGAGWSRDSPARASPGGTVGGRPPHWFYTPAVGGSIPSAPSTEFVASPPTMMRVPVKAAANPSSPFPILPVIVRDPGHLESGVQAIRRVNGFCESVDETPNSRRPTACRYGIAPRVGIANSGMSMNDLCALRD
ncbi:STAS domain-containing protein [Nocardia sp. NPDC005746]|uniref:STAS domain-containing protein n=1 Tax=Nocardia sp. NPDC005746 TaxID=3157062 RepID=UPI0033E39FE8